MPTRPLRKGRTRAKATSRALKDGRDQLSLLHKVHVHQEELQVQNEELVRAQKALEESRERFMELYDFAPNAYLILDSNGVIMQANLVGAQMLERPRQHVEGIPLLMFVDV